MRLPLLVPNLHPFVVHFAVALLLTSTAFFLVAKLCPTRSWAPMLTFAARCNLYLAVGFGLFSVGTGWFALVDARPPGSALATAALHRSAGVIAWWLSLFAAIGVWRVRQRAPGWIILATLLFASGAIAVSTLYGAELTYRHGLGIERPKEMPRMPVAEVTRPTSGMGRVPA